jgi:hypothetical protein
MKITKSQLKQIIKEEISKVLSEEERPPGSGFGDSRKARRPTDEEKKEARKAREAEIQRAKEDREAEIQAAVAREIAKFFPGRQITSPEGVDKRRKEIEQAAIDRAQAPEPTLHPSLDEPLDPEKLRAMLRPSN